MLVLALCKGPQSGTKREIIEYSGDTPAAPSLASAGGRGLGPRLPCAQGEPNQMTGLLSVLLYGVQIATLPASWNYFREQIK